MDGEWTNSKEAAAWAKRTLRDPERMRFYQKCAEEFMLPNAYTAAVRDYMRRAYKAKTIFISEPKGPAVDSKNTAFPMKIFQPSPSTRMYHVIKTPWEHTDIRGDEGRIHYYDWVDKVWPGTQEPVFISRPYPP